ncbi:alpha/beta fold hydrolase [Microbacterium sp. P02]|uniref:alpha/beta fold hydrolase n=1 Tax=Microbacterium sp. P02 TaxID=3366260 RepID=UPI00366E0774
MSEPGLREPDPEGPVTHTYRTMDVAVAGGDLHVGVWDPVQEPFADAVLVHGVTASHLAWQFVVEFLPGVRIIAPDLRGRGRSNRLGAPVGMRAHAADIAAVLDAMDVERTLVVGHSMGAFVALVFAHRHADRVSRIVLVDGGLPLDVPVGMDTDALVSSILGPTAARLSMRFADVAEYLGFWRSHPAFAGAWTPELERYFAYDLEDDGGGRLKPATSYATTADDTLDMNTGQDLPDAVAGLRHPAILLTVPRGLQDQVPGLYAPEHLARVLAASPGVRHRRLDDLNHYTVVMSARGAAAVATTVRRELGQERVSGEP